TTKQSAADILERMSEAVVALDREWHYTYVNGAAVRLTGLERDKLVGQTRREVWPAPLGARCAVAAERAMDQRITVQFEEYYPELGQWFEGTAYPSAAGIVVHLRDLTKRKQLEQVLREREERFRSYFELGLAGIAVEPSGRRILDVSDEICRMLGYERSDLLQMAWEQLVHPDDLAADIQEFDQVLAGEKDRYSIAKRWIRKDGQVVYADTSVKGLRSVDGSLNRFFVLLENSQEISDRKLAEDALRESGEWYRALFESMDEGFCVIEILFDQEGQPYDFRFLETNPAFEKQLGIAQAAGKTVRELVPDLEPWWFETYGRVALTGEPVRLENQVRSIGRWFDVYAFRLGPETSRRLAVLFDNITERVQAEERLRESDERFRAIFNQVTVGVGLTDLTGKFVLVNQKYCDIVGYTREELLSMRMQDLTYPDDLAQNLELFQRLAETGTPFQIEKRYVRKGGSVVWANISVAAIRDASGKPVYGVAVVLEVTDRKRAEEELVKAHDELERRVVERTEQLMAANEALRVEVEERKRTEEELRRSEAYLAEGQRLSHTGSFCWTIATGEVYWSQETYRIYGFEPGEVQPSADLFFEALYPDDRSYVERTLAQGIKEKSDYEMNFRIVGGDGQVRYFQSIGHPVLNQSGDVIEVIGTVMDVTERRLAEKELQKETEERNRLAQERTKLLRQLTLTQEEERRRISREMHDQLGQQLSALTLKLAALKESYGAQGELREQLHTLEGMVKHLDADVDLLIRELRPIALDELGLRAALFNYVNNWSKHFGVHAELHVSGMEQDRLPSETETALYRVTQEALTNVAKHAHARNVGILLERRPDHISLIIEDDGTGFDGENAFSFRERGLGLIGMRERVVLVGGTLDVESRPGAGVTVVVRIPAPPTAHGG
ncbi:MAG TPA: PAS domain S-box protein, partial [Bryobacteraceae bacterium]